MRKIFNDIDKIVANVKTTMAVEGLRASDSAIAISRLFMEGKISTDDAVKKIIKNHIKG